jgi:hypothetical protein
MNSTLIRPVIGLAALLATIPLIPMLSRSLAILFDVSEHGWITVAAFALMVIAYTAFQWRLTLIVAPAARRVWESIAATLRHRNRK